MNDAKDALDKERGITQAEGVIPDSTKIIRFIDEWGIARVVATDLVRVELGNGVSEIVKIFRHPAEEGKREKP